MCSTQLCSAILNLQLAALISRLAATRQIAIQQYRHHPTSALPNLICRCHKLYHHHNLLLCLPSPVSSRVARIPEGSTVMPAIRTEEVITLGAELEDGTVIRGQNNISHPDEQHSHGGGKIAQVSHCLAYSEL